MTDQYDSRSNSNPWPVSLLPSIFGVPPCGLLDVIRVTIATDPYSLNLSDYLPPCYPDRTRSS